MTLPAFRGNANSNIALVWGIIYINDWVQGVLAVDVLYLLYMHTFLRSVSFRPTLSDFLTVFV